MRFTPLDISGATLITIEPISDERGFFARSYCSEEFSAQGITDTFVQCNVSFNLKSHTLRGLHYQSELAPESKIVRCVRGAVYDILADVRPDSDTFGHYVGMELSDHNRNAIYVPPGVAHGFLTLVDNAEVHYMMGATYNAEAAKGIRWDDPFFDIQWPHVPAVVSTKDKNYPNFIGQDAK